MACLRLKLPQRPLEITASECDVHYHMRESKPVVRKLGNSSSLVQDRPSLAHVAVPLNLEPSFFLVGLTPLRAQGDGQSIGTIRVGVPASQNATLSSIKEQGRVLGI